MTATVFKYKWRKNLNLDYENLFLELKNLCYPTFKYKQGNCHNIVQYCSLVLSQKGIKHKKIWYYAPSRLNGGSKVCISKPDPNNLALHGNLKWGYHVALFFEECDSYHIFDLMLDEYKPMTINDWVRSMGLSNYKIDIVDAENYLFFSNSGNGPIQYFQYKGKCNENFWGPKGLAINETAFEFFCSEKFLLEKESDLSYDFKTLVGSVINFECVFKDNGMNKRITIKFLNKHKELIAEYRNIYAKNLAKWKLIFEEFEL
jgi:Glutaminase